VQCPEATAAQTRVAREVLDNSMMGQSFFLGPPIRKQSGYQLLQAKNLRKEDRGLVVHFLAPVDEFPVSIHGPGVRGRGGGGRLELFRPRLPCMTSCYSLLLVPEEVSEVHFSSALAVGHVSEGELYGSFRHRYARYQHDIDGKGHPGPNPISSGIHCPARQ
jgi:hypothetical protein